MNRFSSITLCLLLACASFAQIPNVSLPHVAILGFANKTGDASFDTPAATATESLALTIRLLGSYEPVAPGTAPAATTDKDLLAWCEKESVDYVLYGTIASAKGGAQAYDLAVFDRAKGKTTIRKNAKGASIFDVFSNADTLTFAVIDAIAGRHVGFGSIAFELANSGSAEGKVTVLLDGAMIAETIAPIDRVVEGRHLVSVTWEAPGEKKREIALAEVEVAEGECATIAVTIPEKAKARAASKGTETAKASADMVFVEGGTFTMGSDTGPANERPAHEVTVGSFWMSATEVTQGDFLYVIGKLEENSSYPMSKHGGWYPIMTINWMIAINYCNVRSLKEGLTPAYSIGKNGVSWNRLADGYRLPTEAEWEYAAKGGPHHDPFVYPGSDDVGEVAVTFKTSNGNGYSEVASRKPNTLGIYDMGGNMYEWCWDQYGRYRQSGLSQGKDNAKKQFISVRGGDSINGNDTARCTNRSWSPEDLWDGINYTTDKSKKIGIRVVRSVIDETE